jgi:hypothetical protein
VCICSLRYPGCYAHAQFCHTSMRPSRLYYIFPHFIINSTFFGKKTLLNIRCLAWICLQILSETFHILRGNERDTIKIEYWSSREVPFILGLVQLNLVFGTGFRKILKYKIPWKSVQREPSWSMRRGARTDGRTDMSNITVAFRNFANVRKNSELLA